MCESAMIEVHPLDSIVGLAPSVVREIERHVCVQYSDIWGVINVSLFLSNGARMSRALSVLY